MDTSINETENQFFSDKKRGADVKGKLIVGITQVAVLLIFAILFVILGIIFYQGDWFGINRYTNFFNFVFIPYFLISFSATLYFSFGELKLKEAIIRK